MPAPTMEAVKSEPPRPERGGDAILGRADEAAHHHDGALGERRNGGRQPRVGFAEDAARPACGGCR